MKFYQVVTDRIRHPLARKSWVYRGFVRLAGLPRREWTFATSGESPEEVDRGMRIWIAGNGGRIAG